MQATADVDPRLDTGTPIPYEESRHAAPVVAGVIGRDKFSYDLWGDTVNTASRMESPGLPGRIQVGVGTYQCLSSSLRSEQRGEIEVKGKGRLRAYLLIPPDEPAVRPSGADG